MTITTNSQQRFDEFLLMLDAEERELCDRIEAIDVGSPAALELMRHVEALWHFRDGICTCQLAIQVFGHYQIPSVPILIRSLVLYACFGNVEDNSWHVMLANAVDVVSAETREFGKLLLERKRVEADLVAAQAARTRRLAEEVKTEAEARAARAKRFAEETKAKAELAAINARREAQRLRETANARERQATMNATAIRRRAKQETESVCAVA
ncbi:MAG: hypothetical protein LBI34_03575 [Puniceicoccales bacterium]|jgi:hypothetical protein|nr:hypothetical protein [Puniceicoccales bacterium]